MKLKEIFRNSVSGETITADTRKKIPHLKTCLVLGQSHPSWLGFLPPAVCQLRRRPSEVREPHLLREQIPNQGASSLDETGFEKESHGRPGMRGARFSLQDSFVIFLLHRCWASGFVSRL